VVKSDYDKNWQTLFSVYPTLTAREFSELSGVPRKEADKMLDNLVAEGQLEKFNTRNGAIWKLKA
jgi:hypothetical protein